MSENKVKYKFYVIQSAEFSESKFKLQGNQIGLFETDLYDEFSDKCRPNIG